VARLLALAHAIDRMVRNGGLRDLADAARTMGRSRARISQIMTLLLLAPEIQEAILDLPLVTTTRDPITERQLRRLATEPIWKRQVAAWSRLCCGHPGHEGCRD
jgi:hypothetical protein